MIYLDHASTTYVYPECINIIKDILENRWGNPSNNYYFGEQSKAIIADVREQIADLIHCSPDEIFFTSGSSEGNAWAMKQGSKIVTSSYEHHSILNYEWAIEADNDYIARCLRMDYMTQQYYKDTYKNWVYSHILVSNETGEIFDVKRLFDQAHQFGMFCHSDMTQAFGNIELNMKNFGVDMATFSGHKFHAPKGIGFVYIRKDKQNGVKPLVYGTQQNNLRGGTENVAYIAALGLAAKRAINEMEEKNKKSEEYTELVIDILKSKHVPFIVNKGEYNVPSIFNFCLKNIESETLQSLLSDNDIYIGVGSACSDGSMEVNKTLREMQVPEEYIHGPIRYSYSLANNKENIELATLQLIKYYNELQGVDDND